MDTITIEYISKRPQWTDKIYGTNTTYRAGKQYAVPEKIALKLLKHTDTFRRVKNEKENKTVQIEQPQPKQDETEDVLDMHQKIDSINNTASLRKFIKDKWGVETEKTAKLPELKAQAKLLTNQFGA